MAVSMIQQIGLLPTPGGDQDLGSRLAWRVWLVLASLRLGLMADGTRRMAVQFSI
jgi:hypothetical protein